MRSNTCVHFRGVQRDTCEAGVTLAKVKDTSGPGPYRWPCLPSRHGACATTCEKFLAPTAEQIAEDNARVDALVSDALEGKGSAVVHVLRTGTTRNPIGSIAPIDMMIAIGFGSAEVLRDGRSVLDGERSPGWLTVRDAERLACRTARTRRRQRERSHDWRISIVGPLWEAEWQRQRPGKWVCVRAGEGFA